MEAIIYYLTRALLFFYWLIIFFLVLRGLLHGIQHVVGATRRPGLKVAYILILSYYYLALSYP